MRLNRTQKMECEAYVKQVREQLEAKGEVYMRVRVVPGASKTRLVALREEPEGLTLKIAVTAAPEKGRANAAVCDFLQGIVGGIARVSAGGSGRLKLVHVRRG